MYYYTVVQHSGYGYADKPEFKQGLEPRSVKLKSEIDLVKRVGGVLFDTYGEADDYAFNEMYKNAQNVDALIPSAPGRFSDKMIDGLAIYQPAHSTTSVSVV